MPNIGRGGDNEIADQRHRASRSVALNVAEALGLMAGERQRNHFQLALGSARETMACIELAVATGLLDEQDAAIDQVVDHVEPVCAILRKLTRRATA